MLSFSAILRDAALKLEAMVEHKSIGLTVSCYYPLPGSKFLPLWFAAFTRKLSGEARNISFGGLLGLCEENPSTIMQADQTTLYKATFQLRNKSVHHKEHPTNTFSLISCLLQQPLRVSQFADLAHHLRLCVRGAGRAKGNGYVTC